MAIVLTSKSIEARKPGIKRLEIPDAGLPGFYFVVQPSGVKSWALRYRFAGKPRKLTIGSVLLKRDGEAPKSILLGAAMTLPEARAAARAALQSIAEGTDPGGEKKAAKARQKANGETRADDRDLMRVQGAAFVERYCRPRLRTWVEIQRQFKVEIDPKLGDLRVGDVSKRDVRELLAALVDRGSPITANRVLATLRKFFSWLIEEEVVTASPCAGLKMPAAERSRDRVLTDDELRWLWRATERQGYPFGPFVRLLLLTGCRRDEVAGMQRGELDLRADAPTWTIPRIRVKNDTEHSVPLSALSIEIVGDLPKIGDAGFMFTTTGESPISGYTRAKDRLDTATLAVAKQEATARGEDADAVTIPHWTFHDLRRTAASGMARLGVNLPVIEKVLNHASGSFAGIVGVYQRHTFAEEKRAALEAWARHVESVVSGETANVIPLTRSHVRT